MARKLAFVARNYFPKVLFLVKHYCFGQKRALQAAPSIKKYSPSVVLHWKLFSNDKKHTKNNENETSRKNSPKYSPFWCCFRKYSPKYCRTTKRALQSTVLDQKLLFLIKKYSPKLCAHQKELSEVRKHSPKYCRKSWCLRQYSPALWV